MKPKIIHHYTDEDGQWLVENLGGEAVAGPYCRRRPGQASRLPLTIEEAVKVLMPPPPAPGPDRPEPASVWERPNYGPGARR